MKYGRYEIIKEIGSGSMGVVHLANDPQINRMVAVKVLRKDRSENEEFVRRFHKEAQVIGRLSHPNIVSIYDIGEEQGEIFIAMEFIEGISLAEALLERFFSVPEVIEFGIQIAETLEYAHSKGVIHRDIKPNNIILQSNGCIKITDFGIARIESTGVTLHTQAGVIIGTPAYMSPEQVLGQEVDKRSDIFSLGIVLYELSTGRRPFGGDGKTMMTIFNEIMQFTPQEPSVSASTVPREFSRIIMKALQKNPDKRFQSGKELAASLRNYIEELNAQRGQLDKKKSARRVKIISLVTVIVVALIGIIAASVIFTKNTKSKPAGTSVSKEIQKSEAPQALPAPVPAMQNMPIVTVPPKIEEPVNKTKEDTTVTPGYPLPQEKQEIKADSDAGGKLQKKQKPGMTVKRESKKEVLEKSAKDNSVQTVPDEQPGPKISTLIVKTNPEGANVFVNGNHKGVTPLSLRLDHGKYLVRLERAGYREIENLMVLNKNKEYKIIESLKSEASGDQ